MSTGRVDTALQRELVRLIHNDVEAICVGPSRDGGKELRAVIDVK